MDGLDVFHPDRMSRILGMGDVISLERILQQFDEEEFRKMQKKIFKNTLVLMIF